jgi:hypothetical protein
MAGMPATEQRGALKATQAAFVGSMFCERPDACLHHPDKWQTASHSHTPVLVDGWKNSSTRQAPPCAPAFTGSQCTEAPASWPGRICTLPLCMYLDSVDTTERFAGLQDYSGCRIDLAGSGRLVFRGDSWS